MRHQISGRRLDISDLKRFVAGADVFSKQSDGSTVASQYAKLGITLRCANTERVNGWAEILHRLGDPNNGVPPRLFIHERCRRLVECLPSLQHDPNRPEADRFLTRTELALALKVSLRTVDMMLADGDITPVRLRGKIGAVLFAGCVAGVEGEGKDEQKECCAKGLATDGHGFNTETQGRKGRSGKWQKDGRQEDVE